MDADELIFYSYSTRTAHYVQLGLDPCPPRFSRSFQRVSKRPHFSIHLSSPRALPYSTPSTTSEGFPRILLPPHGRHTQQLLPRRLRVLSLSL